MQQLANLGNYSVHNHKDLISAGQTLSPRWLTQDSLPSCQVPAHPLSLHRDSPLISPWGLEGVVVSWSHHSGSGHASSWSGISPQKGAPTEVPNSRDRVQTPSNGKYSTHSEIPPFSLKNTQWSFISLPAGLNNILNAKIYTQTLTNVFHYSLCKTTFQPKHSINVIKLLPGGII